MLVVGAYSVLGVWKDDRMYYVVTVIVRVVGVFVFVNVEKERWREVRWYEGARAVRAGGMVVLGR